MLNRSPSACREGQGDLLQGFSKLVQAQILTQSPFTGVNAPVQWSSAALLTVRIWPGHVCVWWVEKRLLSTAGLFIFLSN